MAGEPLVFTRDGYNIQEAKRKYKWVTSGPNCDVCNLMRGRVYALIVWWDTLMPGFHPHCKCRLEPVGDDTPESSLDLFGVEPWIDRLNLNTFTRWWIKRLMPWDVNMTFTLTEAYQESGNWKDAFDKVNRITRSGSPFANPRLRIFNTQNPFPQINSWTDLFITPTVETPLSPSASLPHEEYR